MKELFSLLEESLIVRRDSLKKSLKVLENESSKIKDLKVLEFQ
jgi:hypothetical protein